MIKNLEELETLAKKYSDDIQPSALILLRGDLGAGKTTFVRFFCKFFEVSETVNSPSFNLLNIYHGEKVWKDSEKQKFSIYHIDLYRLRQDQNRNHQIEELLPDQKRFLCFVEWPDAVKISWTTWAKLSGARLYEFYFKADYETNFRTITTNEHEKAASGR